MTDRDAADDPYLVTLGIIASELTAIRRALEADADSDNPAPDGPTYECRCGDVFTTPAAARDHAHDTHGCPPEDWRDIVQEHTQ